VGESFRRHANARGISLAFNSVAALAEEVDFGDLLDSSGEEALAVNAAFALHHVPVGDGADVGRDRDAALSRLEALRPRVLTLTEPDVAHSHPPRVPRIAESLAHHPTVFDALQEMPGAHPRERATLENVSFGSEIANLLTGEGRQRVERHERHHVWRSRSRAQGFEPLRLTAERDTLTKALACAGHSP
jgi:hypothetical protein